MSHFAQVVNGVVQQVIVAEQDVIDSGMFGTGWENYWKDCKCGSEEDLFPCYILP